MYLKHCGVEFGPLLRTLPLKIKVPQEELLMEFTITTVKLYTLVMISIHCELKQIN